MRHLFSRLAPVWVTLLAATAFAVFTPGCGGGGGGTDGGSSGGSSIVTGTVLDSRNQDSPVGGARVFIEGAEAVTTTTVDQASSTNQTGTFTIRGAKIGANTAVVTVPGQDPQTIGFDPPVGPGANAALELIINIGQISGRVLAANGQPQAGASVAITSTGDIVETGTDGTFRVDNIPLGDTQITAVFRTGSASKTVTIGNGLTNVGDLTLVEDTTGAPGVPKTIAGTVKTSDAQNGGAGAVLTLFRDGIQIEQVTASSASGQEGQYFFYVPIGNYSVRATKSGYVDTETPVVIGNPNATATVDFTLNPR